MEKPTTIVIELPDRTPKWGIVLLILIAVLIFFLGFSRGHTSQVENLTSLEIQFSYAKIIQEDGPMAVIAVDACVAYGFLRSTKHPISIPLWMLADQVTPDYDIISDGQTIRSTYPSKKPPWQMCMPPPEQGKKQL